MSTVKDWINKLSKLEPNSHIALGPLWSTGDVIGYAWTNLKGINVTYKEAENILDDLERRCDPEQGITWDHIDNAIETYPLSNPQMAINDDDEMCEVCDNVIRAADGKRVEKDTWVHNLCMNEYYSKYIVIKEVEKKVEIIEGFEEKSLMWGMLFEAMKINGNFKNALSYVEEALTSNQYYEIEHFFDWLESNGLGLGRGNYWKHYMAYKEEGSDPLTQLDNEWTLKDDENWKAEASDNDNYQGEK